MSGYTVPENIERILESIDEKLSGKYSNKDTTICSQLRKEIVDEMKKIRSENNNIIANLVRQREELGENLSNTSVFTRCSKRLKERHQHN